MAHSHGHGGCDHSSDSKGTLAEDSGVEYGLFQKIDLDRLQCLNETTEDSGKFVFKTWDQRLDKSKFVISYADEELLFNIPFTGNVKLKGIIVIGGENGQGPNKMRLFRNRPHLTFDDVSGKADQEFEVVQDDEGRVEYQTRIVQFSNVHHLSLHFPSNLAGGEETKIYYIGLKGDFFKAARTGVVNAVYEARPMLEDHKADIDSFGLHSNNLQF